MQYFYIYANKHIPTIPHYKKTSGGVLLPADLEGVLILAMSPFHDSPQSYITHFFRKAPEPQKLLWVEVMRRL